MIASVPFCVQDSTSFLLKEENSVFVGDCILGMGSAVFSQLKMYLASLHKIRDCTAPKEAYVSVLARR